MLKVTYRAIRAKKHANNILTRHNKKQERIALKDGQRQESHRQKVLTKEARTARQEAKEDRMLGPLAPLRVISKKEAEESGAVGMERFQTPYLPVEERLKYWNIVVGDRVVVLKGPDRHKIGVVKSVEKKGGTVSVGGLNMAPLKRPAYSEETNVIYHELPVNYDDVRLVYPLPDPESGIPTDTIIAKIKMGKIWTDKRTKARTWDRLIPGMEGVKIPWPTKKARERVDHLADTRILDVETVTFTPTLLDPPIPVSVIDELRNKYSKFRTRHDVEYIVKKVVQELERRKLAEARIVTPIQELNKKLREERKALGKQVLSEVMLEKIGRVMAWNRPELLEGIQAVPAGGETVV